MCVHSCRDTCEHFMWGHMCGDMCVGTCAHHVGDTREHFIEGYIMCID